MSGVEGEAREQTEAEDRRAALLLTVAAVVGILLGVRATLIQSSASDDWKAAVRSEVKQAAAVTEDARFVYSVEAPEAFEGDVARIAADAFAEAARLRTGDVATALLIEEAVNRAVEQQIAKVEPLGPRYRTPKGGFDAGKRFADARRKYPDLLAVDPDSHQRAGDQASRQSLAEMLTTVPAALAFLFGAIAEVMTRRRDLLLGVGAVFVVAAIASGIVLEFVQV